MLPLVLASARALALYLLPLVVWTTVTGRRAPAPGLVRVLDVGIALSLDGLFVLTLARFVPLALAVWISRALYVVAAVAFTVRHRVAPRPRAAVVAVVAVASMAAAGALWRMSYELIVWDRDWHVPLVSALRAQRVPFENVYLPLTTLRYHYLGDVVAAMLQTLSGDRLHASLALTLAHDLYLALTASVAALAVRALWPRVGPWLAPLAALSLVFASPLVLLHAPLREVLDTTDSASLCGYSFLPWASLSYRPHVVIAGLYTVLFALAVAARARPEFDHAHGRRLTLSMLTTAASMALLDEASLLVLTVGLLGANNVVPALIHRRVRGGLYLGVSLLATLWVVNRVFHGSLSPGGPAQEIALVPARHLALFSEPVPFRDRAAAMKILRHDYFPMYSAAASLGLLAWRTRREDLAALFWLYASMTVAAMAFAFKLEFNHDPLEGHRFLTAAMLLSPFVTLYAVAASRRAPVLRALAMLCVLATTASGAVWYRSFLRERFANGQLPRERTWVGERSTYAVQCHDLLGAWSLRAPAIEYVEGEVFYAYAGCQPARFAARRIGPWNLTVGAAVFGREAHDEYENAGVEGRIAAVVCGTQSVRVEPVCAWAKEHLRCETLPHGHLVRCAVDPASREALYERLDAW